MAAHFFDTSALIRRYVVTEPGAARVRTVCAPDRGHVLLIARLLPIEVASALNGQVRLGTLQPAELDAFWRLFRLDLAHQYHVVVFDEAAYTRATTLLFRHPLKAADALHLAAALEVAERVPRSQPVFWTADRQQARAASTEGLTVELVA